MLVWPGLAELGLRSCSVLTGEAGCVVKSDLSALLRYPAAPFPGKSAFHIRKRLNSHLYIEIIMIFSHRKVKGKSSAAQRGFPFKINAVNVNAKSLEIDQAS